MTKKIDILQGKKLPTKEYDIKEIMLLKEGIKAKGIIYEVDLMKAAEEAMHDESFGLDAKSIIKFYKDIAENAEKVNNKTGEMIPDPDMRMKAMDKLVKILTGSNGASKGVTINMNSQTNNIWNNVPSKGEKLIY